MLLLLLVWAGCRAYRTSVHGDSTSKERAPIDAAVRQAALFEASRAARAHPGIQPGALISSPSPDGVVVDLDGGRNLCVFLTASSPGTDDIVGVAVSLKRVDTGTCCEFQVVKIVCGNSGAASVR